MRRTDVCAGCGELKKIESRGLCWGCGHRKALVCPGCGCELRRPAETCCFCKIEQASVTLLSTGKGTRGCMHCRNEMKREMGVLRERARRLGQAA